MKPLSETQRAILITAAERPRNVILPLPNGIRGGAAHKVISGLVSRSLAIEIEANPGEPICREKDGIPLTLVATKAGLAAVGRPTQPLPNNDHAPTSDEGDVAMLRHEPKTRSGTKQALVIAMLQSPDGATIDEIVAATEWQPHTVRGAISGAIRKRLKLKVTSEKADGRGRVYRLSSAAES